MKHKSIIINKKIKYLLILSAISLVLAIALSTRLKITKYEVVQSDIPSELDGLKILQISDFHCESFGSSEDNIIKVINNINPDIILFTGDMIDGKHPINNVEYLLEGIHDIAPIYSVSGNHENDDAKKLEKLRTIYDKYGVINIDGSFTTVNVNGVPIGITGITKTAKQLKKLDKEKYQAKEPDIFNILLYHYANYFDAVSDAGYDLVFSGHLHGGVLRLPFIGGVASTDGLFPKYDRGMFKTPNSTLIVSAGLGDAAFPRVFNRPELVVVTLTKQN